MNKEIVDKLIQILCQILNSKMFRLYNVNQFVKLVNEFHEEIPRDIFEIFDELALDLQYYEPNEEWRKEDLSFYGDERLEKEINVALAKIENLKTK